MLKNNHIYKISNGQHKKESTSTCAVIFSTFNIFHKNKCVFHHLNNFMFPALLQKHP